jgi:hypothetical protein
MAFTFTADMWRWPGDAAWHFVSLPHDVADDLEDQAGERRGFGSIRVEVQVGEMRWRTSVFPDSKRGTFVLPIKRAVREREGLAEGDRVRIRLHAVVDGDSR